MKWLSLRRADVLWRLCGEGVALLVFFVPRGEAGAPWFTECGQLRYSFSCSGVPRGAHAQSSFASPAVFGSGASLPGDVSTLAVRRNIAARL